MSTSSSVVLKSPQELSSLANVDIFSNLLRFSVEELKAMEDEDGWTFLHYYFAVRSLGKFGYSDDATYQLEEIKTIKDCDFDFYKMAKNNKYYYIDQKTKIEEFSLGNAMPLNLMFLSRSIGKDPVAQNKNALKEYIGNSFILNHEDNIGFVPFTYALAFPNYSALDLLSKSHQSILNQKLIKKSENIKKRIMQLKLEHDKDACQEILDNCLIKLEKEVFDSKFEKEEKVVHNKFIKL